MKKKSLRPFLLAVALSLPLAAPSWASVNVSIGINVPTYPQLQPVPGYPVYYAPGVDSNYFFYGGRYWVFVNDAWYSSAWYDGPWGLVAPEAVPVYLLRVPVRYYRRPPPYFSGWVASAPPHWGERFGPGWEQRHRGWDHWDRARAPRAAPLPAYQRQYSGERYPRTEEQQRAVHMQHESRGQTSGQPPGHGAHGEGRSHGPPREHGDNGRGHGGEGHEKKNGQER